MSAAAKIVEMLHIQTDLFLYPVELRVCLW